MNCAYLKLPFFVRFLRVWCFLFASRGPGEMTKFVFSSNGMNVTEVTMRRVWLGNFCE